jgi:hypothetical protein
VLFAKIFCSRVVSRCARWVVIAAGGWRRRRDRQRRVSRMMGVMSMIAGNGQVPAAADSDQAQAEA